MSAINVKTASFTASDISSEVDLKAEAVMQIRTPDGFGETSLTVQGKNADGDYETLKLVDATMGVTDFVLTVDATTGYAYDVSSIFPAGSRELRFAAGGSITENIEVVTRRID